MTDFIRALRRTIVGALVMGVFVVVSILAPKAQATTGINQQVNFQGRLLTSQGATVPDGYYNIQFKIYQDGTGTVAGNPSGTLKWTESWLNNDAHGVQVKNGYMSVQLGSITSLSSVDWNQDTLWLSINIGNTNTTCTPFTSCSGDGEMLPMKRLSSTPYSLNSGMLGGLTSAQFLQLAQGVQTEAGTNTTSIAINKTGTGGNFLNLQANSVDVFNITNTGDINFGSSIDHAISVSTAAASTAGKALTISAGTAGTGATALTGGTLTLQGGNGGGTGGNGGNLVLDAGTAASGGTGGTVSIGSTNASSISLGQNTTLSSGKSLTISGGATGTRPASPTEGMIYYDTTTKQLLTYSNGKWQADRTTSTKIVAASNASQVLKDGADYVATGTGDQTIINSALSTAADGRVYLTEGTYTISGSVSIPNNTTLAGAGSGTIITIANSFNTSINAITNTTTGGNGTGLAVQDLKLDGNKANQTGGTMNGVYFNGVGSGTGSSAVQGGRITNVTANNWNNVGIFLSASSNNILTGNTTQGNTNRGFNINSSANNNTIAGNLAIGNLGYGFNINSSSSNSVSSNTAQGNSGAGFYVNAANAAANYNTFTGNTSQGGSSHGFYVSGNATYDTNYNTLTGNTAASNLGSGFNIEISNYDTIAGNKIHASGGTTNNNGVYLTNSSNNTITGNAITDTTYTTTNYAINISDSTSTSNYLASNTLGTGTVNDAGTSTVYGGQSNGTSYLIQPATNITVGSASTTTTIQGNLGVTLNATTGTTMVCRNTSGYLSGCDATYLAPTTTNFIQNQNASPQAANFNINGSGTASTLTAGSVTGTTSVLTPLLDANSATTLNIGTATATALTLGKGGVATTAAGGLLTNAIDATSATTLTIGGTTASAVSVGKSSGTVNLLANTTLVGTSGSTITIQGAAQATSNTNGNLFVLQGSTGNGTASGGRLSLQGGTAGTSGNGGDVYVTGGTATGTGATGLVLINTPTYQTATADSACYTGGANVAANCTISSASVNSNGAIIVGFSAVGQTATLPDPVNTVTSATGRVIYITASGTSQDFTLKANSGGGAGIEQNIAMRKNTTATMIWNGADWTAAGASSSTTLQAAYDNTLQSAGGAELVVSKTSATNGLTIRDSTTNSVNGALLNVQSSSAANLFSVNSNVTEYATDAGAEVYGASTTTFPASTWATVASPASTVTRYTTAGDYIATGQGSVSVTTPATANAGVINTLSTSLTANMTYNVSFSARLATGTFTDMTVYYSINGTTQSVLCAAGQTAKTSIWTKINCTFQAPSTGITATNAILIQQATGVLRTFYVDNLSVTIAANYNYAADPGVDDTGMANWSAAGTASVVQNPSDGYDASSSAQVTTSTASSGVRNKLSINPLLSTLYRVSIYAKLNSGTALTDFTVRYTPNGGANFVSCVDYSTQTLTSGWAQITCYIKTDTTALGTPYVYFTQATASGTRIFSVDTFSMTLAASTTPNVQVGSGSNGGPTTLLTLDKGASAPIAANNDALLGSMYYDTTLGKLQCYEADGWGACGSSPDNIITISPEYTNAVMHGTGIGTMISDFCSDTLGINNSTNPPAVCGTNETYNFYRWTSPQASEQAYSIYVTYQLPNTFKSFASGQTSLQARVDSTSNAYVKLQIYKNHSGLSPCGTNVTITTAVNTWQYPAAAGTADPSTCGFVGGDSIVFKITMGAWSNANAYVGNLNFTFSNK